MKQTPIQELIEQLRKDGHYINSDLESHFLEKEKQVIESAVNDTQKYLTGKDEINLGEIYYKTTFK